MRLFTIGFTKKSARTFFGLLEASGARRLVDIRLNNVSQLAGFAKKDDLAFFLERICGMSYVHLLDLAPTQEMLDEYKKKRGSWQVYERRFMDLMAEREVERRVPRELIADSVLLCSEEKPAHCHRRLVAEYLKRHWGDVEITNLA